MWFGGETGGNSAVPTWVRVGTDEQGALSAFSVVLRLFLCVTQRTIQAPAPDTT